MNECNCQSSAPNSCDATCFDLAVSILLLAHICCACPAIGEACAHFVYLPLLLPKHLLLPLLLLLLLGKACVHAQLCRCVRALAHFICPSMHSLRYCKPPHERNRTQHLIRGSYMPPHVLCELSRGQRMPGGKRVGK